MSNDLIFTSAATLALTDQEIAILKSLLKAHDRAGFYMLYNAMTDSTEAGLQSRISTFSGYVGGAALAANRLAQVEDGPNGIVGNTYPGMYELSQHIAESALNSKDRKNPTGIADNLPKNAGLITDPQFFNTADAAWTVENVQESR
ncbi:MAG TPA: hypothetical protein VIJ49_07975 [Aestuariivirga sp.]